MNKYFKALSTVIAGTIGVGFFAIPYSLQQFGTFWGVIVLAGVAVLISVVNMAYTEIIVFDKGNRQVPGYTRKYIGKVPAAVISLVMISGLLGVLLAYAILAGNSLSLLFGKSGIFLSPQCLSIVFVILGLFVAHYGITFISKVTSLIVLLLFLIMAVILIIALPEVRVQNVTSLDISHFSLIFGVALFALYCSTAIPVIDEIVGYDRKVYRRIVLLGTLITLIVYIVFGLVTALSLGDKVSSEFIAGFSAVHPRATALIVLFSLLAVFSAFVLVSNSIKEIASYDYKIPARTAFYFIAAILIWFIMLDLTSFEGVISFVGGVTLGIQSIVIFAIWWRIKSKKNLVTKVLVTLCALLLLTGVLLKIL